MSNISKPHIQCSPINWKINVELNVQCFGALTDNSYECILSRCYFSSAGLVRVDYHIPVLAISFDSCGALLPPRGLLMPGYLNGWHIGNMCVRVELL